MWRKERDRAPPPGVNKVIDRRSSGSFRRTSETRRVPREGDRRSRRRGGKRRDEGAPARALSCPVTDDIFIRIVGRNKVVTERVGGLPIVPSGNTRPSHPRINLLHSELREAHFHKESFTGTSEEWVFEYWSNRRPYPVQVGAILDPRRSDADGTLRAETGDPCVWVNGVIISSWEIFVPPPR